MSTDRRRSWPVAIAIGSLYALVGITFAIPATHAQFWRLAAWAVSAIAFALHIGFEHFRVKARAGSAALHVASAAAIGGFGLAVGALVHSFIVSSGDEHRRLIYIALAAWPLVTALPAFVVAFVLAKLLELWKAR